MNNYDCYGKEQCFQAETKTFFEFEEDFCEMMDGGCYCQENIIEKNCDLSPHVIQAGDQLAYANDQCNNSPYIWCMGNWDCTNGFQCFDK
jgi:hypothetical protein